MADSVGLYAANLYGQIQNRQIPKTTEASSITRSEANNFHKLVENNFNSYAKLSPSEILNKINATKKVGSTNTNNDVSLNLSRTATTELQKLRATLSKQEQESRNAALGKANLVELMTATTEAENYLSVLVAMRDELKGAWDKIWNMSL